MFRKSLLYLALVLGLSFQAQADGIIPDSTFNSFGYRRSAALGNYPIMALDGAGGEVVAALSKTSNMAINVLKLNEDGSLDSTFANNSLSSIDLSAFSTSVKVEDVKIQSDHKIIILAENYNQNDFGSIMLIRLNADGSLDNTFGNLGRISSQPAGITQYQPRNLALDESGAFPKYYVGGTVVQGFNKFFIAAFDHTGQLDPVFNGTGYMIGTEEDVSNSNSTGYVFLDALKVLENGNLMLAGSVAGSASSGKFFICKMHPNGTFDSTYNNTGRVTRNVSFVSTLTEATNITKILDDNSVAFYTYQPYFGFNVVDTNYVWIARQNADGSPMMNFGTNGELALLFLIKDLTLQMTFDSTYRMILGYYSSTTLTTQKIHFTRYTKYGQIDTTFGNNAQGQVILEPIPNDHWQGYCASFLGGLAFDSKSNRLYGAGTFDSVNNYWGVHVSRFELTQPQTGNPTFVQKIASPTFEVFPNPSNNIVHIKSGNNLRISEIVLFNISGSLVSRYSGINSNSAEINLQSMKKGNYIAKIFATNNSTPMIVKLIKN